MVDLNKLFYPENICLIGVSDLPIKGATAHCFALKKLNFEKPMYCVNKRRDKVIFNMKAYHNILEIPEKEIDYVIIGVPNIEIPDIIEECISKHVKFITIFSSGFSELGTKEGIELEDKIVKIARKGGIRIIGPNCLGPFCRESKVTMTEIMEIKDQKVPAQTAFISQSGGHTGSFFGIGENRGFPFNKVVSIGNQCDLTIQDFIEYFTHDNQIKVISIYIEQVKNAKNFCSILSSCAKKKPLIFWKGGETKEGMIAATSHTGAISSSYKVFNAVIRQNGGIVVHSIEELADLTLGSLYLDNKKIGKNVAIMVPGGGSCVEMTDQAAKFGLNIPKLHIETQLEIQKYIQKINTNTRNPIDLGVYGWLPKIYGDVLIEIAKDDQIDVIVFYMMIERLPTFVERIQDKSLDKSFLRNIKRAQKSTSKPFIGIIPNFNVNDIEITKYRKNFIEGLCKLGIPNFESMERAANVISKLLIYKQWKNSH
ncbi:MAG: CoA-binding protein [Candidatus Helarchaeota archaeon]